MKDQEEYYSTLVKLKKTPPNTHIILKTHDEIHKNIVIYETRFQYPRPSLNYSLHPIKKNKAYIPNILYNGKMTTHVLLSILLHNGKGLIIVCGFLRYKSYIEKKHFVFQPFEN